MKVTLLCSDAAHPVNTWLEKWMAANTNEHAISIVRKKADLSGGDILFLVSCSELISAEVRAKYKSTLVLHASDLPAGRGWSPHIWQIIGGAETITLTLMEADDKVDSGKIWKKTSFPVPRHALWYEINARLFEAEIEMIDFAVRHAVSVQPAAQPSDIMPSYFPKRTPQDSAIDPALPLADQFDRIRVCDPVRFPAFFDLHGQRYKLILEKCDGHANQD